MQWDGRRLCISAEPGTPVALDLDGCYFSHCDADANGEACFTFAYSPSGHDRLGVRAREARDGAPLGAQRTLHLGSPHSDVAPLHATPLAPLREPEYLLGVDVDVSHIEVVIVIPVYNAAAAVERCLRSVLRYSRGRARLIVIDDASPDADIAPLLARYRELPGIELLTNAHNLGFTATANRGIERAGRADVVLLNADTEVGPNWLDGLRRAAWARQDIATATAVSDNAGAFSVPELERENPVPDGWSFDQAARALWQHAGHNYPELPTGNGFCLYIRRSVIDAIGLLDAKAFAQGYGEENDFCQRACALGMRHVIAGNVLVHHERSLSFGHERRASLGRAGMQILRQRWPNYERDVGASLFSFARRVLDWRVRRLYAAAEATNAAQP
ncbi:MAG: glycosyltransferase, partial [Dokdonella sp.]